ncbi:hypothetical protein ACWFNE_01270 [Cellulomonas sp. NPDC055163]
MGGAYLPVPAGQDPAPLIGAYLRRLSGTPSGIEVTGQVTERVTDTTRTEHVELRLGAMPAGTATGERGARPACNATSDVHPANQMQGEAYLAASYVGGGAWSVDWHRAADPMSTVGRVYLCTVTALDGSGAPLAVETFRVVETGGTGLRGSWTPAAQGGAELALTSWPVGTQFVTASCVAVQRLLNGEPVPGTLPTGSFGTDEWIGPPPARGQTWVIPVALPTSYAYRCGVAAYTESDWRGTGFPETRDVGRATMTVRIP